jgi:DNA-binding SARP family transcriptional activator
MRVGRAGIVVIDIKILGPMTLTSGGQLVGVGPQQQVLLLVLLLAAGQVVPAGRLAELLWEGGAGDRAPATLRSHVAHLRHALTVSQELPRLATHRLPAGTGYSLRIDAEEVDSKRFLRLAAAGRAALGEGRVREASQLLSAARALWRGRPLPEVADRPFAVAEIRQLQELRRAAWSSWAEAQVRLGAHREVTGELEAMVARWPDDEGLRRLLAVSLHRSGRTGDAVQVCRDGIVLALSQGLDPAGIAELQRELLGGAARWLADADSPC